MAYWTRRRKMIAKSLLVLAFGYAATAPASADHEGRSGIGVTPFLAAADSAIPEIGRSISELLVNPLAGELAKPQNRDCRISAVAVGKEREEILKELEFQKSRFVDPKSRVGDGHLIPVNMTITGTATASDATISWTATVLDAQGKDAATVKGSYPEGASKAQIDAALEQTVRDLVRTLCQPWRASGGGSGVKITPSRVASVLSPFELQGVFPGGRITFRYMPTGASGGLHKYAASGSGVTASGSGTYTITRQGEKLVLRQQEQGCTTPVGSCRNTALTINLDPEKP